MIRTLQDLVKARQGQRELALVFDLDCTLIDSAPLYPTLEDNATQLLMDRCNLSENQARALIASYLSEYGDCVRQPFHEKHGIAIEETLRHIFLPDSLPLELLQRWQCLKSFAAVNSTPKYIFTNATEPYMQHLLHYTDQHRHFIKHISTNSVSYALKPEPSSFAQFEEQTQLHPDTHCIIFFEDNIHNLEAAEARGWVGVWCTEFLNESFVQEHKDNVSSVIVDKLTDFLGV